MSCENNVILYSDTKNNDFDLRIKDEKTGFDIQPSDLKKSKYRNKEYARNYARNYYDENKEEIKKKLAVKVMCDCGKSITKHGLKAHMKKRIHMNRMNKMIDKED